MEESEAQLDVLIHGIATAINDVLSPNTTASFTVTTENQDGSYTVTQYKNVKVLDEESCRLGSDLSVPPHELFTRVGTDRYTEVVDDDGKTWYLYNEEDTYDCKTFTYAGKDYQVWDPTKGNGTVTSTVYQKDASGNVISSYTELNDAPYEQWQTKDNVKYTQQLIGGTLQWVLNSDYALDTSTQYTLTSLGVNDDLENQPDLFPHLTYNTREIDYGMGAELSDLWDTATLKLYPNSATFSFADYYTEMIGNIATAGSTYESTATTLESSVSAIDNQRLQITGVSTDEELANMIKYQNAYNAASRYIQTVSDMIELLVTNL
jgi:flagellar hook-associated protein 1 FlgK